MSSIRKARLNARLSQAEIAAAVEKSQMWVSLVERGSLPVSAKVEKHILVTIARLNAFKKTIRRTKAHLVADLGLSGTGSSIR